MIVGVFCATGFIHMGFNIKDLGCWTLFVYLFVALFSHEAFKYFPIVFMKYIKSREKISIHNFGKTIKCVKYDNIRDVCKYRIYTFGAVNQSKAFFRSGKKCFEKEEPKDASVLCLSEFELTGYEDKDVFLHLSVLSQFSLNYRLLYPTELYYFTVLYLIPALDKPQSPISLISQVVNETGIYEMLIRLRDKYMTQDKLSSKLYSVFGIFSLKKAVEDEYELYKAISNLPIMKKIFIVADDALEEDRIAAYIPERILRMSWSKDKKVRCVYESVPGIRNIDLCFMQRVSEYRHIERSNLYEVNNIKIPWENSSIKDSHAPVRRYIVYSISILMSIVFGSLLSAIFHGYKLAFPLFVLVFLWLGTFNNAPMLASYSFCKECVCCAVPAMYQGEFTGSIKGTRVWRPCTSSYREYIYMYSYSSLMEYGFFEKDGTEYIYASKKHLTDEEFEEFKNRFILCDENTFAMVFDGGARNVIESIPGIRRVTR